MKHEISTEVYSSKSIWKADEDSHLFVKGIGESLTIWLSNIIWGGR